MSSRNARAACDVRVTRDARQWLVCLDGNVVACFAVMGDALDYASFWSAVRERAQTRFARNDFL